jgi:hypothetical protein
MIWFHDVTIIVVPGNGQDVVLGNGHDIVPVKRHDVIPVKGHDLIHYTKLSYISLEHYKVRHSVCELCYSVQPTIKG